MSKSSAKGIIYSIGYGNRTIEEVRYWLQKYNVRYLLDARSRPYSKFNPHFNKEQLEHHFNSSALRYVYMGSEIGGLPSDPACFTNGRVDYEKCKVAPSFVAGIKRLITAYEKGCTVAVMCSEGKPQDCHRSKLLGEMLRDRNIPMLHIDEYGNLLDQLEVLAKVDHGQPPLFQGMSNMTSRKRYIKDESHD